MSPDFIVHQLIREDRVAISDFPRRVQAGDWQFVLDCGPRRHAGHLIWEGQEPGQQAQLRQYCALVPRDVFMIETITPNIDHGGKWDFKWKPRRGNTGKPEIFKERK